VAAPPRRRSAPAVALLALGVLLVLGPIVGGLFSKVAAGEQLLDEFEPHLEVDALARYDGDLAVLRAGAAGIDAVYAEQGIEPGRFVGIDAYRTQASAIDERASALLDTVGGAEPDYRRVADVGGFDRVPFLVVAGGLVATYAGCVLLWGRRDRARPVVGLAVLASAAIIASPFLTDLPSGARAGEHMLQDLEPVMTPEQVRQLQLDFVAIVHAVGELDTTFREVPQGAAPATAIAALVDQWPNISSDLASLTGAINDNIDNYRALDDIDGVTRGIGLSGMAALPWLLVGIGVAGAGLAVAALPRRTQEGAAA
jgi:hypothetical protein